MTAAPQPDQVRQIVAQTFAELGIAASSLRDLNETLLLDNRRLVARTYRAKGLMAMWLINAGLVQFYDTQGSMLRTVSLFKKVTPRNAAA